MNKPLALRLPPGLSRDIDVYEREVGDFLSGKLPAAVLKAKRVPRGVYEQRRDGSYMVRVRVSGGLLAGSQMLELAALGREYGNGMLHVTTRQDVQLHDVAIKDTPAVMRRLLDAGLTSRGGGGNTVRNVTACPYAGICPAERFDVTPCANAVTEYLIGLVGAYNLPRKYKIAFSGCGADCALAKVSDLGFVAEMRDGKPGFRVMAGGGMGAHSRVADELLSWTPATEIVRVSETVRRLFDRYGNRADRHRARLRFVFERMGLAGFRREFEQELPSVVEDGVPQWEFKTSPPDPGDPPDPEAEPVPPSEIIIKNVRVIPQRQNDFVAVPLHLPLGFLSSGDFQRIGELASRFSAEAGVRATRTQDLMLRFVKRGELAELAAGLRKLSTDVLSADPLNRFVACAGAATCRLGICLARDAARACAGALAQSGLDPAVLDMVNVHINGCTNACGQQPVAALGLFGAARRVGGRLVPTYGVTVGGRCGNRGARFGQPVGKVPARSAPACVRDLMADFQSGRTADESFDEYVDRTGIGHFEEIVTRHVRVPAFEEQPEFYHDLGSDELFSLAGRGAGECGAGVFEVVRNDLAEAAGAAAPFDILLPTARALLITRGIDARNPDAVLREFERHFIDSGLVTENFRTLLVRGRAYALGWDTAFNGCENEVSALRDRVDLLFHCMDANLEFKLPESADTPSVAPGAAGKSMQAEPKWSVTQRDAEAEPEELDLRGVACPMNFVKAKLKLETMSVGQALAIVLDDGEPIQNVPASFKNEGQAIESMTDLENGRWRVIVRKMQ